MNIMHNNILVVLGIGIGTCNCMPSTGTCTGSWTAGTGTGTDTGTGTCSDQHYFFVCPMHCVSSRLEDYKFGWTFAAMYILADSNFIIRMLFRNIY